MLFEALIGHTLIAADDTWGLLGAMCISVALSIWLEQKYRWASKVSGAIIALILAMIMANIGVIPVHSVLYDEIVWGVICPMGIPLLLLQCNLKKIWKETGKMLAVFLCGSLGTMVGALIAYFAIHGFFGNDQGLAQVASMMTGSYIGGGVNFAAMASQYNTDGTLVSAATVADNLLMALYFFALIAFAGMRFFRKHFTHPHIDEVANSASLDSAKTQAASFWGPRRSPCGTSPWTWPTPSPWCGSPPLSAASSAPWRWRACPLLPARSSRTSSASSWAASTCGSPPSP